MLTKAKPAAARATRPAEDDEGLSGQDTFSIALPHAIGKAVSRRTIVYVVDQWLHVEVRS
ncbi:MAG: hypothetical protein AB7F09_15845 [Parvibaculaceae bacterium]